MPRPSASMVNMESDGFKVFNGLDQNLSDEEQLAKKMTASCEGLSFRGGKLSTNQFGYGCIPFTWTKSTQRGYGIVPSTELGKFFTVVAKVSGSGLDSNTHLQSLFDFTSTSIDTHNPKLLVSSGILNGVVVTADGNSMRKYFQTTVADDLSILPLAPTFSADSGTSGISGTYLYRVVLLDVNLNETGGGTVSASHTVTNQVVNLTLDLTGYVANPVTQWRYVRFFRTTNGGATYYFLNQQTLVGGTTTYTYADSTSDATLTGAGSYQLINPDPAPAGFYADVIIVDDNRAIAIATTESGTYYPNRVRWTVLTDSSDTSTGNVNSWRANDYEDIQNDTTNENIGGYAGLGGRTFIFAKNGTWAMAATGDKDKPFTFAQIDSTYGLYHHSIDNAGGYLIGRTRDGLATFNGSTLKPIGQEVSILFKNCLLAKGDSGAYDYKNKRYYLSVLDSRIVGTYISNTGTLQEFIRMYRNTMVCFDVKEGCYEVHSNVFLQVIKNIQDSNGNFNIFGVGFSNDVHIFVNGCLTGPSVSLKAPVDGISGLNFTALTSTLNKLLNRKIFVPIFINATDAKISFMPYSSTITASVAGAVTLNDELNIFEDTSEDYLAIVDVSNGTTTTGGGTNLVDEGNNFFLSSCLAGYSAYFDTDGTGQVYTNVYARSSLTVQTSSALTGGSASPASGRKYLIAAALRFPSTASNQVRYHFFKTPLFGTNTSVNTKCFRYIWLNVRGSGVLRIRTYLDGNTTVDETRYVTLADRNKWVMTRVDLKGSTGDTMAIDVGMARGAGDFECQEITLWWRKLGRLRNA